MSVQLCNIKTPVRIPRESLTDLDIFPLFKEFISAVYPLKDDDIESFINTYMTADINEILRRNEILYGLSKNAESKNLMASVIGEYHRLSNSLSVLEGKPRPLMAATQMLNALNAYISSIDYFDNLFISGEVIEINKLAEFIQSQKSSAFYSQVRETLNQVNLLFKPLKNATLAVNLRDSGDAVQIGVTNINLGDNKLFGLFGNENERVNSLFNPVQVKLRSPLVHLEDFILVQVEKQWAKPLSKTLRLLKKINKEILVIWMNWIRHIALYYLGLLLWDKLIKAGSMICKPELCMEEMEAESMQYPYLILSTVQAPIPQDFSLYSGDAVLITGANGSGKTSTLKAFAQNCILAQLGFWIPAKRFRFIPYHQWFTVFSAGEDNVMQTSRFQQEAERMRLAIEIPSPQSTCLLLNEPFTSTNPVEASELLRDIIIQLNEKKMTLILVTHMYDIYHMLRKSIVSLRSYTTIAYAEAGKIIHTYSLVEKEPDGLSYARILAKEHKFSIGDLIQNQDEARALELYLTGGETDA